jgi:ABC-type transport system substrate-binding protein
MHDIWHSKGQTSAVRRWDSTQDKIDSLIEAGLKEFDLAKRKQLVWDLQRQQATYLGAVQFYYAAQPIQLAWRWVKNFLAHTTTAGVNINNRYDRVWIDESLKS